MLMPTGVFGANALQRRPRAKRAGMLGGVARKLRVPDDKRGEQAAHEWNKSANKPLMAANQNAKLPDMVPEPRLPAGVAGVNVSTKYSAKAPATHKPGLVR